MKIGFSCNGTVAVCEKKSGCTCPWDSAKEIPTCLNYDASLPAMQQQLFCPGLTCPSDIELVNFSCPNPEYAVCEKKNWMHLSFGQGEGNIDLSES